MNNWKIHFGWTIAFGVFLLVATATFWLGGKGSEIVSYITFAGALISIILALIAIFYSMIQHTLSQQNIGEMRSLVTQASYLITQKAAEIGVHSRVMAESAVYLTQQSEISQPMKAQEIPFDFYASYCSHTGILAIYCLAKSHETGKPMSLLDITQQMARAGWSYFNDFIYGMGILIGFACFLKPGSVDLQLHQQKPYTLPKGLKGFVLADIDRRIKDPSTNQEYKDFLTIGVQKIDAYFAAA